MRTTYIDLNAYKDELDIDYWTGYIKAQNKTYRTRISQETKWRLTTNSVKHVQRITRVRVMPTHIRTHADGHVTAKLIIDRLGRDTWSQSYIAGFLDATATVNKHKGITVNSRHADVLRVKLHKMFKGLTLPEIVQTGVYSQRLRINKTVVGMILSELWVPSCNDEHADSIWRLVPGLVPDEYAQAAKSAETRAKLRTAVKKRWDEETGTFVDRD